MIDDTPRLTTRNTPFYTTINTTFGRTKSAAKPFAQDRKLLHVGSDQVAGMIRAVEQLYQNPSICILDKAVTELLMLNGCRISEVLRIKSYNINELGYIIVKVSKGNHKRHLISSSYKQFWLKYKRCCNSDLNYRNRFYYYRLYKKYGIQLIASNGVNYAVTHSFRNLLITVVPGENDDLEAIKNFISHKSIKSTIHYHEKSIKRSN